MKFPYERVQDNIESYQRIINQLKNKITESAWQRKANTIWEIDNFLALHPVKRAFWTASNDASIEVYFFESVSIEDFSSFFDYLEECMAEHGFYLSTDPIEAYKNESNYVFVNEEDTSELLVRITSGICKQMDTGRMVPEIKTECNFLKDG